jgi:hypothetical protein
MDYDHAAIHYQEFNIIVNAVLYFEGVNEQRNPG